MTTPTRPPLAEEAKPHSARPTSTDPTEGDKAAPLQLELPGKMGVEAREPITAEAGQGRPILHVRALASALVGLVLLAGLATGIATFVFPWYVRRQCIELAAAHGIDLSVDDAKIATDGFRLLGVRAASALVPGARAHAPQVDVQTSGLRPEKMTVRRAELTLTGPFTGLDSAFSRWRLSGSGGQAGDFAPASLAIEGARVVWQGPIGDNLRVDAADVHAQVSWSDRDADMHVRSEHVIVGVPEGAFGPWRVDIDRVAGASRMRVALDPGVPEACTILIVNGRDRTTSVDVVIPRSPIAHLGVPDRLLGSSAQGMQLEATIHYAAMGPARADANGSGSVYGIGAAGFPYPLEVTWQGTASGDPTAGIDIRKARLAVGPLVGAVTGTLKRFDDGFRVDLAWTAGPVPCAAFGAPLAQAQSFDNGYALRKLSGVKVKGDVRAALVFSFDSRDLGSTKANFTPEMDATHCFNLVARE